MNVFWHQRDLRLPDNRGLAAATASGPTIPVYIVDPTVNDLLGTRQRAFLMQGLNELKAAYRAHGSDLLVRTGDPADVLPEIVEEYDADRVYYNDHYRPERRDRKRRVATAVATEPVTDLVLVDPRKLDTRYENHGRFYDDWQAVPKPEPAGAPNSDLLAAVADDEPVPEVESDIPLPAAGYEAARDRYDRFLENGIERYSDRRDDMTAAVAEPVGAVSRMSPYLAAGMIGIRELWADASDRHDAVSGDARRNVQKYRYELSWREANYHLLVHNPTLLSANYQQFPNQIAWENDQEHLAAWKAGETGYPLVDAGMRQLNEEGYIHNRPRQNVASFLTKHLLVDWRTGAQVFADRLIDHDPANNYGNWQWIASTGTDSVDVRIFDPVAQMDKYDSGAEYVTEYVPELRGVPPGKVVEWPTLSAAERDSLAPAYPDPIVDRNDAYERAQRVFEEALGKR